MLTQNFDKTAEYNDRIRPIVEQLRRECSRVGVPMFVSVCVRNNDKETTYRSDMISAVSSDIRLHDDKLVDFTNVLNGFVTIPRRTDLDFDDEYMST